MKFVTLLFLVFLLGGCVGQSQINVNTKRALETIDDSRHPLVVLTKTLPVASSGTADEVELHAVGLSNANITLYSDNLCTQLIETKDDPSGAVDFTVNLTVFGTYNYYAKQTRDGINSNCTAAAVSYTYRPDALTTLTLVSPVSPGTSDSPVIEADNVLVGATVNFYSSSSCLTPAFVVSANESGFKATATASLSTPGTYQFYATQVVGGVSSACSTSFITYVYNAPNPSAPAAVTLTKTSPVTSIDTTSSVVLRAVGETNADISLYSDSACTTLIETKTDASGTVDFTVNLSSYGVHEFYSKQTKNALDSVCTSSAVTYSYRPPMLSTLALASTSPTSPGTSNSPVLEADNVVTGATVNFYMDAACLTPSLVGSATESSSKATATATLSATGSYNFYATQVVGGVSSVCSTNSIAYTYMTVSAPSAVALTKTSPTAAVDETATVVLHAVGEANADISLYSDSSCTALIETKSDASGELDFTVNLTEHGAYQFYAKQTNNSLDSVCTSAAVTYSYRPPILSALALVSPTSPGGSANPVLEASGVVVDATVNFYTDSACIVPSFNVSVGEYNNKGNVAATLSATGSYNFYATQVVNGVSSLCSTNSIAYTYSTGCTASDDAASPYARGAGTASDPYIICTAAQFNQIGARSADWAKHFELKKDIDYNSVNHNIIGGSTCGVAGFTGVFNGGNHIVSNFTKSAPTTNYVGVFGCFNGTLKDITFTNVAITGQDSVGIVGHAGVDDGLVTVATISNVKVTSGGITGVNKVGGIAGMGINAVFSNNFTQVSLNTTGQFIGGIVGETTKYTHIHHNESKSTIAATAGTGAYGGIVGKTSDSIIEYNTTSGTLTGRNKTGGIAGQVASCMQFNNNSASVTIPAGAFDERGGIVGYGTNCTFTNNQSNSTVGGRKSVGGGFGKVLSAEIVGASTSGTVTATNEKSGGVVGALDESNLNKCFSNATVNTNQYAVGGVVGYVDTGSISNCYFNGTLTSSNTAAGAVVGAANLSTISYSYSSGTTLNQAKGFIGELDSAITFNNNYYNGATSVVASAGLAVNQIESKTAAELQIASTFLNWNFNSIWNLTAGNYPTLLSSIARTAGTFYVSPSGSDNNPGTEAQPWKTLRFAGSEAMAGDTIILRGGTFTDTLVVRASGTSTAKIVFKNYPGEIPVISPSPLPAADVYGLVDIKNSSYIEVDGLELTGVVVNSSSAVPMGVWVSGRGENITLKNLKIHGIENNHTSGNAHGILVAGSDLIPLKNITIENNEIYDLKLGYSESLVLNGNVDTFLIKNNIIRDNNNIGIDIIGLEDMCVDCTSENDRARNGVVSFNTISNITSASNPSYGGSLGAVGVYVDGGKDVIIENNSITTSDYGIELATELPNSTLFIENITVRNNIIFSNKMAGLATGGYSSTRKGCNNCKIVHNTFYKNATDPGSNGEFYFQYNSQNITVQNNIFYAGPSGLFVLMEGTGNTGMTFNNNLYYTEASPMRWRWNATNYASFAAFATGSSQEASGYYGNPLFTAPLIADFSLQSASPAKDTGLSLPVLQRGTVDFLGLDRLFGTMTDIGAHERH